MSEPIAIDGLRLEVQQLPGADPAIVLLHEALGSVGLWRGLPEDLAAATGRRTIAFSRAGHGDSDPPPPGPRTPAFFDHEADVVLPALLERLEVARPVLVGHSDGATIALLHAARHPVLGAAVLAPHVFVEDVAVAGIRAAVTAYGEGLRERMARHHRDPDVPFRAWSDLWLDPAFGDWNVEAELAGITAPLLVVQGRADEYATLAQVEAVVAGTSGRAERLITAGGHQPHLEHRDEIVAALAAFVAGC